MKRWLAIIGLGAAGLLVAAALSLSALTLAGTDISEPASTVDVVATPPTPKASDSPKAEVTDKPGGSRNGQGADPGPRADDHGALTISESTSSSGSTDSGSNESSSEGPGSGDSRSDEGSPAAVGDD